MNSGSPSPISDQFWIVSVGASAGGLEALTSFVKNIPLNINAAFIIAQHLAPHSKSMMVELLSRHTELSIIPVHDKLLLKPGIIAIVPPNFDATFVGDHLKLTKAGEATRPKPSVDVLFRSMAETFGKRAVGIILSGTGSDGTEGVKAIKNAGGFILAQTNESAKYDGMPRSAQETGLIDRVLPPEVLGERLSHILDELVDNRLHPEIKLEKSQLLPKVLELLKEKTNRDFSQYKVSTVGRRLEKRIAALGLKNPKDYLDRLRDDPAEAHLLGDEMLINVTQFFRDTEAFQSLKKILGDLIEQKHAQSKELRIWVAGCASGEEAYSLAIMALELNRSLKKAVPIKVFATDLDQDSVDRARAGVYSAADLNALDESLITRYFDKKERLYEAKRTLRDLIVFARQNLIQNPPFVKIDLISCRNVMIYFESSLQTKVFEIFHYALNRGGILFLGKSESAPGTRFEAINRKEKIFKKLEVSLDMIPDLPRSKTLTGLEPAPWNQSADNQKSQKVNEASQLLPLQLLSGLKISAVLIDEKTTIYHMIGKLSRYLALPTGVADFKLVNLVSKDAATELSILVRKAVKDGKTHRSRIYPLRNKPERGFAYVIRPIKNEEPSSLPLFIVSFEPRKMVNTTLTAQNQPLSGNVDQRYRELEHELASTKEHLQTLVEELEVSNEELQSVNEELSSTNEELQASNEELETTNEELQSTNEEMITVNEELNTKSAELRLLNLSLENIQNSIGSPLLVVDSKLRLLSYNQDIHQIFNVSSADVGDPITQVSCKCEIANFEGLLRDAVHRGVVSEGICEVSKMIFQVRVYPNRAENDSIIGAVVVFFNNTEVIRAQEKLRNSTSNIRAIIDGSPALISLKDLMGNYLVVNRAFTDRFNLTEEKVIGKTDREVFSEKNAHSLRDHDLEVLLKRLPTEREETITIANHDIILHSRRFLLKSDQFAQEVMGTVSLDITSQVKAQRELKKSENRYRAVVEDQTVFVCRHLPDGSLTFTNSSFSTHFANPNFFNLISPLDIGRVKDLLTQLNSEHPVVQYEHRVSSPLATASKWVRWIHRAIFDDRGKKVEFQAVGFDVTEIHNQTDFLLQKDSLFTHILEHTSDLLTVYRVEGDHFILESFNQSSAKNLRFTNTHLVGKKLTELTDSVDHDFLLKKYREALSTGQVTTFEEEIEFQGGARHLSTTLVPIRDQDQQIIRIAALSRDITPLKKIEQALREKTKLSDSANQAKSDFLAAMSHELRTPLNVITGMAQLLNRGNLTPQQQKFVASIQNSGKILLSLIEDVLDLSKIEAGKLTLERRPFSLGRIVLEVIQTFESQAQEKGIKLNWKILDDHHLPMMGDQLRLKQVLINLIGNALKFTRKGSVSLTVNSGEIKDESCEVEFIVEDTGIGIHPDSFHKIFNRFSQAESGIARQFGGTGLGLAICKQLVDLMGGQITFTSEEGKGTTFRFKVEFPIFQQAAIEATHLPEQDSNLNGLNILAIDDNTESLMVLQEMLGPMLKKIYTASSAEAGIEIFQKHNIDLILMDIQMPKVDGLEATKRIRNLPTPKSKVPIIAVTANTMAGDREKYLASDMDDYVPKPINFKHLHDVIAKWAKPEGKSL